MRGVGKVADDRYWSRTVVIDVRFSLYLAAILDLILFPFPPTHAEKLVINWSINVLLPENLRAHLQLSV
jgi:hypothetical protein